MKKKEKDELKKLEVGDLEKRIGELAKTIISTKLELKLGKVKDVHMAGKKRKDLARLKAMLSDKLLIEKSQPHEGEENVAG